MESILSAVYRGDWPARLWGLVPASSGLSVARHRLRLPAGAGRPGLIAFVSDLHIGPTTPMPLLEQAFDVIRRARPDMLLLGGDYVYMDATPQRLDVLARLVSSVACPVRLAVLGNHDLWADDGAIVEVLSGAGATVLINQAVTLPEPWDDVVVLGLDDPLTGACDAAAAAAAQTSGSPVRIVLCHSPDGLEQLADIDYDLYLCGHTHGGHLAAPWGPIVVPSGPLCRQYSGGFARVNGADVYVSRGIGGTEVPMRTFATPDVLLVDLVRE
ncbi:MAG: metallophosphoesterase [Acidobacteriota bacterium]|nr:metallophosphoesterase [Acidobacteriota bacterium]